MNVKEISVNQRKIEEPTSSRIQAIHATAAQLASLERYMALKSIERFLLEDSRNDVTFTEDGNDFTLEWWDADEALCSITFWENQAITVLKGKKGKTLVRERFTSDIKFQTEWKSLLL